jgi:tyrosyl-tRNA synthetase
MDKINQLLTRRVEKVYPSEEKLEKVLRSGKKICLYQGFDPSKPNLHIGHLVGLLTLKKFQELGHKVIFLIGDFTGMIGDPTGKSETRKALTHEQVLKNGETYKKQAGIVLDFKGDNPVKLKYNSKWNSKLKFEEILKLAQHFTVQQLIERDMFQRRLNKQKEIYLSEFMYPLIQGYDSVAMEVDLEVGGSDQMFNMMAGRKLVKELLGKEKFVVTTKLLADSNGKKIGKTSGNAINITNPPDKLFGQIMSLPDSAIQPCFRLITELPLEEIESLKQKQTNKPMQVKKRLAFEVVNLLYNQEQAKQAQQAFEKVFQKEEKPENIPTFSLDNLSNNPIDLAELLVETELVKSKSQAKRLISQGAVKLNNQTIEERKEYKVKQQDILRVGKRRWVKIIKNK